MYIFEFLGQISHSFYCILSFGEVGGSGNNIFYVQNCSADTIRGIISEKHEAASAFFKFL